MTNYPVILGIIISHYFRNALAKQGFHASCHWWLLISAVSFQAIELPPPMPSLHTSALASTPLAIMKSVDGAQPGLEQWNIPKAGFFPMDFGRVSSLPLLAKVRGYPFFFG